MRIPMKKTIISTAIISSLAFSSVALANDNYSGSIKDAIDSIANPLIEQSKKEIQALSEQYTIELTNYLTEAYGALALDLQNHQANETARYQRELDDYRASRLLELQAAIEAATKANQEAKDKITEDTNAAIEQGKDEIDKEIEDQMPVIDDGTEVVPPPTEGEPTEEVPVEEPVIDEPVVDEPGNGNNGNNGNGNNGNGNGNNGNNGNGNNGNGQGNGSGNPGKGNKPNEVESSQD